MENRYNIGDAVEILFFNLYGRVVAIESADFDGNYITGGLNDTLFYRIDTGDNRFVTVSSTGIIPIIPHRVTDEQ